MMQVKFSGRQLRGARVVPTRSTAPARTTWLDFKVSLPVHALRIETIRAPGENARAGHSQPTMTKAV
jgi:hypothetical protein